MNPNVLTYRWVVFLLAASYAVYYLLTWDIGAPGGPFRYLTIWALFLSLFCASRLIALTVGRSDRRWDALISATAVVNAMVVFLYWRLFLDDPSSVTRNGEMREWWLEFYIHGVGPLLMWIDALFIHRSFRKYLPAAATLLAIVVTYLSWAELFVARFNTDPIGSVTSGLPYRFLNNLELPGRMSFYAVNVVTALVLLAVFFGAAWLVRRGSSKRASGGDI